MEKTKNNPTIICFDIDLTLITEEGFPIYDNIQLLRLLGMGNTEIHLWSGGGADYAAMWGRKLGFEDLIEGFWHKTRQSADTIKPDLTFDDQGIELGKVNIKV